MPERKPREYGEVAFYGVGVEIYNGYKISKDGLSREEDVEVMKGITGEDERKRNVGWKIWQKAFSGDEKNGSKPDDG